ncbi:META domain-containing protein [Niabella insulamsoli]|uniref:META domain-containing protein n=1 Tax=Niabella insulamsoli TaxID=3144874 RepID=UPI0031FD90E5
MKKILTLIAVAAIFISCGEARKSTSGQPMESISLKGRKWKLIEIYGQPVAGKINNKEPFIEFNEGEENRYAASGGCNGLGGTYELSDHGRIQFKQGMSTMMACNDMTIENQLKKVFAAADNYTIANNILSLNKAKMAPLARFEWVDLAKETAQLNGTWEADYISGPRIAFNGLYPDKKPVITFNLPDTIATGNSSCNNFRVTFKIKGSAIQFGLPMATKMACPGEGESTFFKTLQRVNRFSVSGTTLNLIVGDIAVMRLQKKS